MAVLCRVGSEEGRVAGVAVEGLHGLVVAEFFRAVVTDLLELAADGEVTEFDSPWIREIDIEEGTSAEGSDRSSRWGIDDRWVGCGRRLELVELGVHRGVGVEVRYLQALAALLPGHDAVLPFESDAHPGSVFACTGLATEAQSSAEEDRAAIASPVRHVLVNGLPRSALFYFWLHG